MANREEPPCIYVLAGTNGAGKSSIAGAMFLHHGIEYFNPDEAARQILLANPGITRDEANAVAWNEGKRLLELAIAGRLNFAFETTLGGQTISRLLETAISVRIEVRIWYVGLNGVDLHLHRVRSRVAQGGHDIPEARIRDRYDTSRLNLIRLLPKLTELRVYDNSKEANPWMGGVPEPELILHMMDGRIVESCNIRATPEWAKPVLAAAIKLRPR